MNSTTPTNTQLKVSMIEDIKDISENVTKFIGFHQEFKIVNTFDSVESFIHHIKIYTDFSADIILLDIGLPGISGLDSIPIIHEHLPAVDIIMLTTYEEEDIILKAICSGACSYISKKSSLAQNSRSD